MPTPATNPVGAAPLRDPATTQNAALNLRVAQGRNPYIGKEWWNINSVIEKTYQSEAITDGQLEAINRYTRRALRRDEVFVFSLILCDNEVDRDYERFTKGSLEGLRELFVGRTGVFDHSAKASNQSGRIFETGLEENGRLNSLGEPYCALRAWAYMLRSPKNEELIFEIDGGIKKEVSVGCRVEKTVCSICEADMRSAPCEHIKGARYDGLLCHHLLENPVDAYEWSFVAVPAQKGAGVTKRAKGQGGVDKRLSAADGFGTGQRVQPEDEGPRLEKLFESGEFLRLGGPELAALRAEYYQLAQKAMAGEAYIAGLRGEVVKLCGLALPELRPGLCEELAGKLDIEQLGELRVCLRKAAGKVFPPGVQLASAESGSEGEQENPYSI
ncbi:MAG: hypothetical protein FWE19_08280 [Oscillospiraceae bacterium]|nr:hypothetical protein [Oscillospiraceae bacterium]